MGCKKCENEPILGAYYRWKNATIEIIACKEHWLEIREVLNKAQNEEVRMEGYKDSIQKELGITEERTVQLIEIAHSLAEKMDSREFDNPSKLLLHIQGMEELTGIEKLLMVFRFGQIA